MPKKNIEDVYDNLFDMIELMDKLTNKANDLVTLVSAFSGELKRVISEQMNAYFIPTINKLKDDENTPGCIKAQIQFLDSIELGQMRMDTSAAEYQPNPEVVNNIDPSTLPASSSVSQTSEIPMNASYNNPEGIQQNTNNTPVQESVMNEKHKKYCVKRKGIEGSALGNDVANIEAHIVNEYNTRPEAELACDKLNRGVLPGEKELLGTEYFVDELVFGDDNLLER